MLPIKKIAAPTDFSDASKKGLQAAAALAEHFSAEIHLVYVVTPIPEFTGVHAPAGFHMPSVLKELEQSARSSLKELIEKELPEDIDIDSHVFTGDPASEIVTCANEIGAGLVVIATHGKTGWKRLVTGSVTEKVIRYADIPVLSVHCGPEEDEG